MATIATMNVMLGMDGSDFERGIGNAQRSLDSMSKKLQSSGTALSLGVTAPLMGIATVAVTSAADFEKSMNVMAQVSGATTDQMATLQAQALELGAATSFSAGEAAAAQLELAKAGLSVNDIIAATPGVLDMAAAGGMGLAESAEVAANALNAFNLPASEVGNVANMLAAAANASSVDISDLAASMKMSGAVFAANKQPMDQMVTALAMLGNAGLKGSDAGTSLKTMLLSLATPTAAAAKELANMGVAVYNADGSMRSFESIVADMSVATASMSDAQRNAALSTIFGSDAIRAATILTRDYSTSWGTVAGALNNGSAAADVANARMQGVGGAIEYLKGSIDSFLIGAALPYMAAIGDMIRSGADLITAFGSMPQPIMDAAVAFGAVLAAAGPVMLAISGISAALGFLLSPIGLIVVGVAALAAAWTTNFGGIRDITTEIAGQVGPALQSMLFPLQQISLAMADAGVSSSEVWEAIKLLPPAIQPVAYGMQDLYTTLEQAATMLGTFLAPAVARVQEAFAGVGPQLTQLAGPLGELQAAFVNLWTAVQPILAQFAAAIGIGLAVSADVGINTVAAVIGNLPALIMPAINQISASINLIATTFQSVGALITAIVNGDWAGAWKAAESLFQGFYTYFNSTLSNLQSIASAVFTVIAQIVTSTLTDMGVDVEGTLRSLETFWTGIWDTMSKAVEPVMVAIEALKKGIEDFSSWLGGISIPNPFAGISFPSLPAGFSLPGMATGGPVSAGVPYIVGEKGQEVFVPNVNGRIIPNHELGGWAADLAGAGAGTGGAPLIGVANVYNDVDIRALSYQVAQYQQRRR